MINKISKPRACQLADNALDFKSRDCGFEYHHACKMNVKTCVEVIRQNGFVGSYVGIAHLSPHHLLAYQLVNCSSSCQKRCKLGRSMPKPRNVSWSATRISKRTIDVVIVGLNYFE